MLKTIGRISMKIFGIHNNGFTSININNKIKKHVATSNEFCKVRNSHNLMTDTVSFKGKDGLIKPITNLKNSNKTPPVLLFILFIQL